MATNNRYSHINFTPPDQVRDNARRGLELRSQHKRGGTLVGVMRARDLSNGKSLSRSTINRMVSFFARHNTPREQSTRNKDKTSPAYISWMLWGGDAGRDWAISVRKRIQDADESKAFRIYKSNHYLNMFRGNDGNRYMMLVAATGYKDRENEWIPTPSMKADVEERWKGDEFVGKTPLMFWHDDPDKNPECAIGEIIWANMVGPFLVEVARETPSQLMVKTKSGKIPYSTGIWDYIEQNPNVQWGASIGFTFLDSQRSKSDEGQTYGRIYKFETSVLPLENASNEYTFAGIVNMKNRDTILNEIFGDETVAGTLKETLKRKQSALTKGGVRHKARGTKMDKNQDLELEQDPILDDELKADDEVVPSDTPTEPMLEDESTDMDTGYGFSVEALAEETLAQLDGATSPEDKLAILTRVLSSILDEEVGEVEMDESEVSPDAILDEEMPSDVSTEESKEFKLLELIVATQKSMFTDMQKLEQENAQLTTSLKELNRRTKSNSALTQLTDRVKMLEQKLKLAPRSAARGTGNPLDGNDESARVVKQVEEDANARNKLAFFTK